MDWRCIFREEREGDETTLRKNSTRSSNFLVISTNISTGYLDSVTGVEQVMSCNLFREWDWIC